MISIIIIVKNEKEIEQTLENLLLVEKKDLFEILVIDGSKGKLKNIQNQFKQVNWILFEADQKEKISIPEQRNKGIHISKGEIIVFIDSNCIPENDWLINIVSPITNSSEDIVCGKTVSYKKKTIHDSFYNDIKGKYYVEECSTINLAIRKKVFEKVGYFDESFEYGSDLDFIWRCIDKGYKVRYEKNAIVSHDWGNTQREIKRSFKYGEAKMKLYIKHKNRQLQLLRKDYFVIFYSFFIIFSPITFLYHYYLLLLLIPFVKNINKSPFLVIRDHLIHASGFLYYLFRSNEYEK